MTPLSDEPTLLSTLKTLLQALPHPPPQYCLIGALAVGAWGRVRATQDIDLLVLFDELTKAELVNALETAGFLLDTRWSEENPFLKGQALRCRYGIYPVDLLAPRDEHERDALARSRVVALADFGVRTCSPEDLILLKLKAGRPQDFEDALGVAYHQRAHLDQEYLWRWADRLGLQGELHYVLITEPPTA